MCEVVRERGPFSFNFKFDFFRFDDLSNLELLDQERLRDRLLWSGSEDFTRVKT